MTRRITAALLAFVLLFTMLPVNTEAKVYRVNTEVALRKTNPMGVAIDPNNESSYAVPYGCHWEKKRNENGALVEACYLEAHPNHLNCPVNASTGRPTCGLEAHTHSGRNCRNTQGWVWIVVRDEGYEGWDYDPDEPANYEFSVCCIDATGAHPFAGVGFGLTRPATEQEKQDALEQTGHEISKTSVLEDSRSLKTNAKGFAYFDGTCKETEPAGEATWTLVQSNTQWTDNEYRPHSNEWKVDVTVHGDGTYTVNDIREANGEEEQVSPAADFDVPPPTQGYDKDLKRLIMIHEPVQVNLYINAYNVPRNVDAFDVSVSSASGTMQQNITMQYVEGRGWNYTLENLEPGTYSIRVQNELTYPSITYKAGYNENAIQDNTSELTLGAGTSHGMFQIHFATLSNNVKLYSVYNDADGTPVGAGVEYGLFLEGVEGPVATCGQEADAERSEVLLTSENWQSLWDDFGTDGEELVFTLKQTAVPQQHTLSEDSYTLVINKAPEGATDPFVVEVLEATQWGENFEPVATFVNAKPDMSHIVRMHTYDAGETPSLLSGAAYSLMENGEEIELENPSEIDFAAFEPSEARTFLLTQKLAPGGHDLAKETYQITLQWEDDKPVVEVTEKQNALARLARLFSGDKIQRDNFGRWMLTFTSPETVEPDDTIRPDNMSNTLEIYSVDNDRLPLNGFRYGLFRDTYKNGEEPIVEFQPESDGMVRITSEDWMEIATNNQGLATAQDILDLQSGKAITAALKQSGGAPYYDWSGEEYTLTLKKASNGADLFAVEMSVAKGTEPVRYNYETGAQKVTFVQPRENLPHCVSIRAYDEDTGDSISGGSYTIYKDGEAIEYCSEADIYIFGEYEPGEYILKQNGAPSGYSVPADQVSYKITITEEDGSRSYEVTREQNLLERVTTLFSDNRVAQDAFGRWKAEFHNPKTQYAQVQLKLEDVQVIWGEGSQQVEDLFADKSYRFLLFTNQDGTMQQLGEPLTLSKDTAVGTFDQVLPVGAAFEIRLAEEEPLYDTTFTSGEEVVTGTVYKADAKTAGATEVGVELVYDIKAGTYTPSLKLTKVDATDTAITLEGAVFQLKNGAGDTTSYTTGADGVINVTDKIQQSGTYTLEEVTAPQDYKKLDKAVSITVGYEYVRDEDGILRQNRAASAYLADYVTGYRGEYFIKNVKKTKPVMGEAEIRLSLEDIGIKWNDCDDDTSMRSKFATRDYKFILSTLNEKDEWKDDPHELTLSSGATTKSGVFRTKVPVGTTYKVRVAGTDNLFDVQFTNVKDSTTGNNAYMGTVASIDGVDLKAKPQYDLFLGDTAPGLYLIKVNARNTTKTLAGAEFVLKDEDGGIIAEFVTKRDGEITIGNQYQFQHYPAKYTLKEVTAPDNYVKMNGVIEITVDYQYTAVKEGGKTRVRQDLKITPYHKDVTQASDGSYYIKNTHESDIPKTGDTFNPILWSGLLTVSAAGLALMLLSQKRRRIAGNRK